MNVASVFRLMLTCHVLLFSGATLRHADLCASRTSVESLFDVQPCSASSGVAKTLFRGAALRIASDLSGGTVFESIKCRVTTTTEGPLEATKNIIRSGGILALWTGTPTRTFEGAFVGAIFMLSSTVTKKRILAMTGSKPTAALAGGLIGGLAQALIMTPAGLVFTHLNYNRGKPGHENDTAVSVTKKILREKGLAGLYSGYEPMAIRQASNWASRATLTEVARSTLGLTKYGVLGEIGSGVLGGLGSCWNTPVETIRVLIQRDVSTGQKPKSMSQYWTDIVETEGCPGLFRGVTPRALQAVWQTVFLIVVPNILGF